MAGIRVDKCGGCKGIYFDSGELEMLLKSSKPEGFFDSFKKKLF
jgi:Zn-finger nucleic acid-binding protein